MIGILWDKLDSKIKCKLCLHKCLLKEGQKGICKVRIVENGNLIVKNFMKISYEEKSIEDTYLYHFYPFSKVLEVYTLGNNLNAEFFNVNEKDLKKINSEEFVNSISNEIKAIVFSFEESLMSIETVYRLGKLLNRAGFKNVFTTNAYFSSNLVKFISKYFEVARIVVYNSLDKNFYSKLGVKNFEEIYKTITYLYRQMRHVEVLNFIDRNNDIKSFSEFLVSLSSSIPMHIITKNLEIFEIQNFKELAEKSGLRFVYSLDLMEINTKCYNCGNVVIDRINGKIDVENNRCKYCGARINLVV